MHENSCADPIARRTSLSSDTWYPRCRGAARTVGALLLALFLNACVSNQEPGAPAPPLQGSLPGKASLEHHSPAAISGRFGGPASIYRQSPITWPGVDRFPGKDPTGILSVA